MTEESSSGCRYVTGNYATDAGAKRALDVLHLSRCQVRRCLCCRHGWSPGRLVFTPAASARTPPWCARWCWPGLALLGFKIDKEANNAAVLGGEGPITVEGSRLAW